MDIMLLGFVLAITLILISINLLYVTQTKFIRIVPKSILFIPKTYFIQGYFKLYEPEPFIRVVYSRNITLPKKVYKNESKNISINLIRSYVTEENLDELNKDLQPIEYEQKNKIFYEIEFQPAGLNVAGDLVQRKRVGKDKLSYYWNCTFPHAEEQEIRLVQRLITETNTGTERVKDLDVIEETIKVSQFLGLTMHQVKLLSGISAFASIAIAAITAMSDLSDITRTLGELI